LANAVAGPQSGYAWHFNKATYDTCTGSPTGTITAACVEAATREFGPWNRIQYPGSQIAYDIPGDTRIGQFVGGLDASNVGHDLSDATPLPAGTNAIRFAFGQLTNQRPEFAFVKMKVNDFEDMLDPSGCPVWRVDTFGGDAGGDDNGKDHIWRYYDPNSALLNGCLAAGKPATRDIVKVGDFFQYKLKLYNGGNVDLVNVVVTDQLPTGVTYISAVPAQNSGPNPLRWVIGNLPRGTSWEATVTVRASGTGLLRNTMTVTGNTSEGDPISTTVTEVTLSGTLPYLRQDKSVTPAAAAPGDLVDYTIVVDNIGTGSSGSPLRIIEYLPVGFTYDSLVSATINGAAITPAVDASNPNQPIFTFPAAIQAQNSLRLTFKALISPDVEPGSYCNSFTSTSPGRLTTGSLACVQVAGGLIGDTIWYDWNGDGVQDDGELGIPGVAVTLYESDGVTVIAQTTTDANGRYYFPGLIAGNYVVGIDASNFDPGGPLAGFTQTFDPDGTVDNQHPVTLSENQQYLIADFGYQPAGSGAIGDTVFADIGNDGQFNLGTDIGISGVTVYLYADVDGDGIFTPGVDALITTTTTDATGNYSFAGLAEGFDYLVVVDPADAALAAYFGAAPYQASTPNPQPVPNLTGTYNNADFGFWEVEPASIGDQVFIDNDGDGLYDPGVDTPLAGVTVNLFRDGQLIATTVTGPDGTYLFDNLGPGSYTVIVDAASAGVPAGFSPAVGQYIVTLAPGDTYLDADFPFVPLISKTVDQTYAQPGDPLNFSVTVNYPGSELLADVTVRDFVPVGTIFSSAGQGGTLQTFAPQPAIPGETTFGAPVARVYAFQGLSATFWAYNPAANSWTTTLANAPGSIALGSALTNDGERYIYAFQGGSRAFYRYDAINEVWSDTAVADLPLEAAVTGDGSALVYLDGSIYAFIGGSSQQFWRYDVSTNSWTPRANTLATILRGGSLATDGENIYGLRGDNQVFWRYNVDLNTWTALQNTGQNIREGAGLVYADDGFFYATTGGGNNRFYRYDIDTDSWTRGQDGIQPNTGGDLATDGTRFWVTQGDTTASFVERFFASADVARVNTPGNVVAGGALTYLESPGGVATSPPLPSPGTAPPTAWARLPSLLPQPSGA
jgi:uncharacterized repeat protein (TIGR01451 family)